MRKLRWGVLGVAKIAVDKVIPAMQQGEACEIVAIASRSLEKATDAARRLGVPRAYGSYEALLQDPDVEAIFNPLPNHLHVPWSIEAAAAGKHVLCEKPIAMNAAEARELLAARDRHGVLIQEAFMVRTAPQWLAARELVRGGRIGELRAIQTGFAYSNRDPQNVRNQVDIGGGGLYDIGCYAITTSRFLFGAEPRRVAGALERDPELKVDRLTSGILEFAAGHSVFTASTQLVPFQRTQVFGTKGRIEILIPFNAPVDRPCRIVVDDGRDVHGTGCEVIEIPTANQYTVQGDAFSRAVLQGAPAPVPLEDGVANMTVIDALFRACASGCWETID
jgi:predicted dehydrogenase